MKDELINLSYLNIMHNLSSTRIYYIPRKKYFFVYTANMIDYVPVKINTAKTVSEYLYELLKNDHMVDLHLVYPNTWPQKKKDKIPDLGLQELTQKTLLKFILILI